MATDAWGHAWGGPFTRFVMWGAAEQITLPSFGPPFLDRINTLTITLGAVNPLLTAVGTSNPISPDVELQTPFRSSRIDRNTT